LMRDAGYPTVAEARKESDLVGEMISLLETAAVGADAVLLLAKPPTIERVVKPSGFVTHVDPFERERVYVWPEQSRRGGIAQTRLQELARTRGELLTFVQENRPELMARINAYELHQARKVAENAERSRRQSEEERAHTLAHYAKHDPVRVDQGPKQWTEPMLAAG
jgi:hypothetical protein